MCTRSGCRRASSAATAAPLEYDVGARDAEAVDQGDGVVDVLVDADGSGRVGAADPAATVVVDELLGAGEGGVPQ